MVSDNNQADELLRQDGFRVASLDERRCDQRLQVTALALVQRVDSELNTIGSAFPAVTRDLSSTGIGLVTEKPLEREQQFAVRFVADGKEVRLLVESTRSSEQSGTDWYTGLVAVQRLDTFPYCSDGHAQLADCLSGGKLGSAQQADGDSNSANDERVRRVPLLERMWTWWKAVRS